MNNRLILALLFGCGAFVAYAALQNSHAPAASAPFAARTVIAPAAGMTTVAVGASLHTDSVSLAERGGDPESSDVPCPTEQEAHAPAGAPESPPAGVFPNDLLVSQNLGCSCGENCPCKLSTHATANVVNRQNYASASPAITNAGNLKKPSENFNVVSQVKTAPAQPPAPAMPTYAPAAQWAAPYVTYQPQRPTFTSYYYGSCGPGGCGPARGWFGRRR